MQTVSDTFLTALRANSKSQTAVCEFYHQDAVPGENGFDPADDLFLLGVSNKRNYVFRGRTYQRLIAKNGIGRVSKTINKQLSGCTLTLSNTGGTIIDFENETGFEGLICIIRLVNRATSIELTDSSVLFTGRCEAPDDFDKSSLTAKINVKQILNAVEVVAPRRLFTAVDILGRPSSDPENEAFIYTARGGQISYKEKVPKGGFFGAVFGMKKTVTRTKPYSSHSDLQEETCVPLVLGRTQAQLLTFAHEDKGAQIDYLGFWGDGHEYGLSAIENIRSVSDGFPIISQTTKLGKKGGLVDDENTQSNDAPDFIVAGTYSRTAYSRLVAGGTTLPNDDPSPTTVGMIFGQKLPIPNSDGTFTLIDFSDSAVAQSRWMLSSGYYFNLPEAWHDDEDNLKAYDYGNHLLVDNHNTDTALLNSNQIPYAGVQYKMHKPTGSVVPEYWNNLLGLSGITDAFGREVNYQFYDQVPVNSDDWLGDGVPQLPATKLLRRFTCNLQLLEQMSAIDFLFDIVLASSNLYYVQKANGKIAHRNKKPEDFTFVRTASAIGATEIEVENINYWLTRQGKILIGATLSSSEVREITGVRYSTAGNSIAIGASGGLSASAAFLSGASDIAPASAILTVTSATGTKNYSIGDTGFVYNPEAGESTATAAAFIAGQINSHEILNKRVKAVWNGDATITVTSRMGIIELDTPLEFAHLPALADPAEALTLTETAGGVLPAGTYQYAYSYLTLEGETVTSPVTEITIGANKQISVPPIAKPERVLKVRHYFSVETGGVRRRLHTENDGSSFYINSFPSKNNRLEPLFNTTSEELHRIAFAFTDKANTQTNLTRSNVLKATFKFPKGGKAYNQVKIKFRDAAADYKLTTLIINDDAKQAKAKKPVTLEINGAGIDNEHQARRIANSRLAEEVDGNKFFGFSSDNEALLIEEGDIICCTDAAGRLINEPARVQDADIENCSTYPSVSFVARKYRRYYFDDQVQERIVPLPIIQNAPINTEQAAPTIYQSGAATNTRILVEVTDYTESARYRKIQIDENNLFSSPDEVIDDISNQPGGLLGSTIQFERSTGLASAETKYVRVAHSSNGVRYGAWSNVLTVAYTNAGGTGGTLDTSDDVIITREFV